MTNVKTRKEKFKTENGNNKNNDKISNVLKHPSNLTIMIKQMLVKLHALPAG